MTHRIAVRPVGIVVAAGTLLLAGCEPAGERGVGQTAMDTAAIISSADSLRTTYREAYNADDTAVIAGLVSGDFVFLPAQGPPISGRQDFMSFLAPRIAAIREMSINSSGTTILDRNAVVEYGTATFTVGSPGADTARSTHRHGYLIVSQRTADGWKLSRAANTRLQPPASTKGADGGN